MPELGVAITILVFALAALILSAARYVWCKATPLLRMAVGTTSIEAPDARTMATLAEYVRNYQRSKEN